MSRNLFIIRRKKKKQTQFRKNDTNKKLCANSCCSNYSSLNRKMCKVCRDICTECASWKDHIKLNPNDLQSIPTNILTNIRNNKVSFQDKRINIDLKEFCYYCRPKCNECFRTPKNIIYLNKLGYWKCRECISTCHECNSKDIWSNKCHCLNESFR